MKDNECVKDSEELVSKGLPRQYATVAFVPWTPPTLLQRHAHHQAEGGPLPKSGQYGPLHLSLTSACE